VSQSKIARRRIRLEVDTEIELEGGPKLAPGAYAGKSVQIFFYKDGETVRLPKKYFIELDAEQIETMGGTVPADAVVVEYEITRYLEAGLITTGEDPN
jgi:hypothetical protein